MVEPYVVTSERKLGAVFILLEGLHYAKETKPGPGCLTILCDGFIAHFAIDFW